MIDIAIETAKAAGQLGLKYFKNIPEVKFKKDNSPVTIADVEAEKLIRKIISGKFPDHGFIGEELPSIREKAQYVWVIDPIDGTRDFIRQIPNWSVMIALLKKNVPVAGVIFLPSLDILITAQKDKGTRINGKRGKV